MGEHPSALPRVLVVDDNAQNCALARSALEDEGYDVALASSGEEALAAFDADAFDCVLLDVRMPGLSGFEVCRQIRRTPRGADIPIVFLTALRDVDTFDEAREAGGDDFLTKPLRPAELILRVQTAVALRRLNAENRGYFDTIREQRDALMRLSLQTEQLTAFLVHDLKNPVNALDLHAQLLLRDRSLSPQGKDSARAIRQEARRLTQLITNMLDLSKAEAGDLVLARGEVELRPLFDRFDSEFRVRAQHHDVQLEVQLAVERLFGDGALVERALANLLDNALRYAPPGSTVSLSAAACDAGVELRVADRGSGVPPSMRESIFERYVQNSSADRARGGHGLGLAFCKLVATLHGGSIAVEEGAPGAVFVLRIPHER